MSMSEGSDKFPTSSHKNQKRKRSQQNEQQKQQLLVFKSNEKESTNPKKKTKQHMSKNLSTAQSAISGVRSTMDTIEGINAVAMANQLSERVFNGTVIPHNEVSGYLDATRMCQAANKELHNYIKQINRPLSKIARNLSFLADKLSHGNQRPVGRLSNSDQTALVYAPRGRGAHAWVHPLVAIDLAMWCSKEFHYEVIKWTARFLSGDLALTTDLVNNHAIANPERKVRATVVSAASQEELDELHASLAKLQGETKRSESVVADSKRIIVGLRSEVRTLVAKTEIDAASSQRHWAKLTATRRENEELNKKFEASLEQVTMLQAERARLQAETSTAHDRVNEIELAGIQIRVTLDKANVDLAARRLELSQAQRDAAQAEARSTARLAEAEAGSAAKLSEADARLQQASVEAAARLADASRAVDAAELRSTDLEASHVETITALELNQAELIGTQTALAAANRSIAAQRALTHDATAELTTVKHSMKLLSAEATFGMRMNAAAAASGDPAALGALVPLDATRITNPDLHSLVHSLSNTIALNLVYACQPSLPMEHAPGSAGESTRRAVYREQVLAMRDAISYVMYTSDALAEACVTTRVATNHVSLNAVLCLLIKARLAVKCTYSTELPITHALFYARRHNEYMRPHGYRGFSVPHDVATLHPEFVQEDIQLDKLLEIKVRVIGNTQGVQRIKRRLNAINLRHANDMNANLLGAANDDVLMDDDGDVLDDAQELVGANHIPNGIVEVHA
jgi:murein DD-endopeptidase MepM/ murein hydrolase activator NlpD